MHGQFNCYTVMFISSFSHVRLSLDNKRLLTYLLLVIPSNIVLDRVPGLHYRMERFGGRTGRNLQFARMPPSAKLLWPLLTVKNCSYRRQRTHFILYIVNSYSQRRI